MTTKPFWDLRTLEEIQFVRKILIRRFPATFRLLAHCLEDADPLEIVYPNQTSEYDDVVREALVLLASADGNLALLTREEIENLLHDSIARCFGERPNEGRMQRLVDLVVAESAD